MNENENETNLPVEGEVPKKSRKKFFQRRSSWFLVGFLVMLLIILIGVLIGIPKGINDRVRLAETQASPKIQAQLESAKLDIEEERYQVALERLDWILEEMAPFMSQEELEEVGLLYSQTLLKISTSGKPTPVPSPTPTQLAFTPTPDLRGEEELYTTAQSLLANQAWNEVIQTLEALRNKNLTYKAIQVDGMLYVALRNRGVQKILAEGSLEPGLYDLALAEQFAPLDSAAEGYRTWTRYYLTGASFWGVDWAQVVFYFEQVYPMLPNLRDGTFMTATERYRVGAIEYAKELAEIGDFCQAQAYFEKALAIQADPEVQLLAVDAAEACLGDSNPPSTAPTPEPTEKPDRTKQPTEEPTEEPAVTPTETPPAEPTEEPTVVPTE